MGGQNVKPQLSQPELWSPDFEGECILYVPVTPTGSRVAFSIGLLDG